MAWFWIFLVVAALFGAYLVIEAAAGSWMKSITDGLEQDADKPFKP